MSVSEIKQCIIKGELDKAFRALKGYVPAVYEPTFEELKQEFMQGIKRTDYTQRLIVLVDECFNPPKYICVLILASTKVQVAQLLKNQQDNESILARYGTDAQSWKPYLQETIGELLEEFPKRCQFTIKPTYITTQDLDGNSKHDFLHAIDKQKNYHILVADGLVFCHTSAKIIAQEFNNTSIGGCLMPVCETLPKAVQKKTKKHIEDVFKDKLHYWLYNYANLTTKDTGFVYVDLEVPNKHQFLRKLSHIAHFHISNLQIPQEFEDLDKFIDSPKKNVLNQTGL